MAANGRSVAGLSSTVGALYMPATKRKKFPTMWVDLIHAHPANQLFRTRAKKFKNPEGVQAFVQQIGESLDDEDKLKEDLVEMMFTCFMHDWGSWVLDENDRSTAAPLYFEDGQVCHCTLENAITVFREVEGGVHLFFALYDCIRNQAFFQMKQSEEEKNFLLPLPTRQSLDKEKSTPAGQKPARTSKRSVPRKSKPTPSANP